MADIISIATALPQYCHQQKDILQFMQEIYGLDDAGKRILSFLYKQSGINTRYSVISDYHAPKEDWNFIPTEKNAAFPFLEKRMTVYKNEALPLSIQAIENCLKDIMNPTGITHLITVSCTGMSAPGLDLEIMEAMNLSPGIFRSSVNFMGCYAAVHALKQAKMICDSTANANVMIVATELCTLHFQQEYSQDNAASSLLFSDGSAAVLVSNCHPLKTNLSLQHFFSQVAFKGKKDMAWELGSQGFLMTLSGYIPQLIEEDISGLVDSALLTTKDITHWCIHPGGRKIVDLIQKELKLDEHALDHSRNVLAKYGNMSSPTILFVLKEIMEQLDDKPATVFGVAFGPGLTMETFIAAKT